MIDVAKISNAVAAQGRVARVVVADVKGSAPREIGASMLVWDDGQSGTIGGGALEFEAARSARSRLTGIQIPDVSRHPLGPKLGQCCGGSVTLVTEVFDAERLADLTNLQVYLRPVEGSQNIPLSLKRMMTNHRNAGSQVQTLLEQGWFIEPLTQNTRPLWIWGAGHVGRAMVHVFGPIPEFEITWIDTDRTRFPDDIPACAAPLMAANPVLLVPHAPPNAEHLILTYSHALDLELCHQLLNKSTAFIGLIGSNSKWARFQNRLSDLGHNSAQISRITCPIGDPSLGKHPHAIAIGVAAKLLMTQQKLAPQRNRTA